MAANITELTDASFAQEVLKADQPVLVDFWAPWCGPCRQIAPHVEALATELAGKIKVGKMNVDDNPSVPTQYRVQGIPTLLLFKGGQVQEQIVGFVSKDVLKRAIDKHV
ncbi:MAG: thioredoxin [Terriglobales bacterium]